LKQEHQYELLNRNNIRLSDILKVAVGVFAHKGSIKHAKLYNKSGLEILDEDVQFIKTNDIFYVAFDGEEFNNCALLDEYEMGQVLGEGGFGKVVLGRHLKSNKKVAIKFMDIGD